MLGIYEEVRTAHGALSICQNTHWLKLTMLIIVSRCKSLKDDHPHVHHLSDIPTLGQALRCYYLFSLIWLWPWPEIFWRCVCTPKTKFL